MKRAQARLRQRIKILIDEVHKKAALLFSHNRSTNI